MLLFYIVLSIGFRLLIVRMINDYWNIKIKHIHNVFSPTLSKSQVNKLFDNIEINTTLHYQNFEYLYETPK